MAGMREQQPQFAQRLRAHDRLAGRVHVAAGTRVEHPHRDLDGMRVEIGRQPTADEYLVLHRSGSMNPDDTTEPRVPRISNL